jgi:hypothetical protein
LEDPGAGSAPRAAATVAAFVCVPESTATSALDPLRKPPVYISAPGMVEALLRLKCSEIAHGVDVFKLVPNKFLTQNEIDAANQVHLTSSMFRTSQKSPGRPISSWPAPISTSWNVAARLHRNGLPR